MEWMYANLNNWLVDHPAVREFEWNEGQTFGASTQFLTTTVITYLSLAALLHNSSLKITTLSSLRIISVVHNLVLIILSFIMTVGGILSIANQMPNYRWIACFPNNTPRRGPIFFWGYIFYLSKILEFTDTLLIILNNGGGRRLTFFHVYHHAAVVVMCYIWLHAVQSLFPVGMVTNSCMHVLMYTYYMMCSLGRKPAWKRLVTDCQISQFVFGYVMSVVMLWFHFDKEKGGCSGFWSWVLNLAFNSSLLALFIDFHLKCYATKKSQKN